MKRFKIDYLFNVLLLITIGLILFSTKTFHVDDARIDNEDVISFNQNWFCYSSSGNSQTITLPDEIPLPPGATVTITNRIPVHLKGQTLVFRTTDQLLRVFVDDAEIYSFGIHII